MNAFQAYELYVAIKTHFTRQQYDFFKFNGQTKATTSSFENREDKYFFYKIAKKYSKSKLTDLFVANFVDNPDLWIGDLLDETSEDVYNNWRKKIESLTYHFTEECRELLEWTSSKGYKFNDLFKVENSDHPIIVKISLQRILSLESFIILNRILDFGKHINKILDDIIWKQFWLKVCKYEPFLNINLRKCKIILRNMVEMEYPNVIYRSGGTL